MKEKLGVLQEMNYVQIWGICNTDYGGILYKAYRESKKKNGTEIKGYDNSR